MRNNLDSSESIYYSCFVRRFTKFILFEKSFGAKAVQPSIDYCCYITNKRVILEVNEISDAAFASLNLALVGLSSFVSPNPDNIRQLIRLKQLKSNLNKAKTKSEDERNKILSIDFSAIKSFSLYPPSMEEVKHVKKTYGSCVDIQLKNPPSDLKNDGGLLYRATENGSRFARDLSYEMWPLSWDSKEFAEVGQKLLTAYNT